MCSGDQSGVIERGENLINYFLLRPVLRCHEVGNRFVPVNSSHNLRTCVFVRESKGMTGLVTDDPKEFGIRSSHRKAIEVHCRLTGSDPENIRPQIGPVTISDRPADSHLGVCFSLDKLHVCRRAPSVHMRENARPKIGWGTVEEPDCEANAILAPVLIREESKVFGWDDN